MDVMRLIALSESSGFRGGYYGYEDKCPGLTLDEAAGRLPIVIMEAQMGIIDDIRVSNDVLVEAVVASGGRGMPLVEFSFSDLLAKVKAFFKKILDWIKSIIEKLKVRMDTIFKTGSQLWDKYKGKLHDDSFYKGLEFTGWKFKEDADIDKAIDINAMLQAGLQELGVGNYYQYTNVCDRMFNDAEKAAKAKTADTNPDLTKDQKKANEDDIKALGKATAEKRKAAFANYATGGGATGTDWMDKFRSKFYGGDKATYSYGKENFTKSWIGGILSSNKKAEDLRDDYQTFFDGVDTLRKTVEDKVSDYDSKISGLSEETHAGSASYSDIQAFTNIYLSWISDASSVVSKILDIKVKAEQDKQAQAKAMLSRMITWKGSKQNSDASEWDGDLEAAAFIV